MRLTNFLNHGFGHLGVRVKNQIVYTMSPFEQSATKGVISKGFPNTIRRIRERILCVAVPGAIFYGLYKWTMYTQTAMDRKKPKDFENDL